MTDPTPELVWVCKLDIPTNTCTDSNPMRQRGEHSACGWKMVCPDCLGDMELAEPEGDCVTCGASGFVPVTDPTPSSGQTWVCDDGMSRSECVAADHLDTGRSCGFRSVPGSDTPSDERACERPGCGHPMDDHDGEHGCEDCVMCPAYVPPIGSRLHGQWAGSNEDPVRWCALCGTWEDEADWITHSGHASLFPTDDVRHADAVTAEPEWSTRPVPSTDTPSDERRVHGRISGVTVYCSCGNGWPCPVPSSDRSTAGLQHAIASGLIPDDLLGPIEHGAGISSDTPSDGCDDCEREG